MTTNEMRIRKHYRKLGESGRRPDREYKVQKHLDTLALDNTDISNDQEAQEELVRMMDEMEGF
jgi:hypothetical protein